jgi:hypothetical protein
MPIRRRVVPVYLSFAQEELLDRRNLARRRRGLPSEQPPRRQLFVEQLEGHTLLFLPVFQTAPLNRTFREIIARERDLPIKTVRLERGLDPEAVIIKPPLRLLKAWRGLLIPDRRENSFTQTHHLPVFDDRWIGMTRDRTWVDNGPLGPSQLEDVGALSLYVNQLVGLDENGAPPRRPRQGPIPDDDAAALENLVP